MAKPRSKLYYWFPVIVLMGLFLVLGVAVMLAAPYFTSKKTATPAIEPSWLTELKLFLAKGGLIIYGSRITTDANGRQQLELTIDERLDNGHFYNPYLLHQMVHVDYYYELKWSDTYLYQVDSIVTRVVNAQGDYRYAVIVDVSVIDQLFTEEITDEQYLASWEISEGAPEIEMFKIFE